MSPSPSYDPFKDEFIGRRLPPEMAGGGEGRPARKRPQLIDWRRAARLMAQGQAPEAVAETLRITEERLWKHLHKSMRFRFYLSQALERQLLVGRMQFAVAGTEAVVRAAREGVNLTAETLKWIWQEAGAAGDGTKPAADLIARLGGTGKLPARRAPVSETDGRETDGRDQQQVAETAAAAELQMETKQNEAAGCGREAAASIAGEASLRIVRPIAALPPHNPDRTRPLVSPRVNSSAIGAYEQRSAG